MSLHLIEIGITSFIILFGFYIMYRHSMYVNLRSWFLCNTHYKEFLELPSQNRMIYSFRHMNHVKWLKWAKQRIKYKKLLLKP